MGAVGPQSILAKVFGIGFGVDFGGSFGACFGVAFGGYILRAFVHFSHNEIHQTVGFFIILVGIDLP